MTASHYTLTFACNQWLQTIVSLLCDAALDCKPLTPLQHYHNWRKRPLVPILKIVLGYLSPKQRLRKLRD
jgi:hypothetical protein